MVERMGGVTKRWREGRRGDVFGIYDQFGGGRTE